MKRTYEEEARKLAQAIDIAIEAVKTHPPKGYKPEHIEHFVNSYMEFKSIALNPKPQYKKLASLKHNIQDVFTFFQEGSGDAVDFFWRKINEHKLPYERENRLQKILTKKKIKNYAEYDYVIDNIVLFEQEGLINRGDVITLNKLLADFEKNKAKK